MKARFKLISLTVLISHLISPAISSAPWIGVDDISLRADIQLLADSGIINLPVTTYPMMWTSVFSSIKNIDPTILTDSQKMAYTHIKSEMRLATTTGANSKLSVYGANESRQFSSFGENNYEKSRSEASHQYINESFSGKLQVNYRVGYNKSNGDRAANLDGSYLAYKIGNWVVDLGAIQQWWGPGLDTSLIMSNNARPLPALAIRRNNSSAFETPWLSWIGPWTLTAQMAQLESHRTIPEAKMWSSRATFKPYRKLELGLSWSYQWGGKGQPNSLEDFARGLLGETECVNGASSCDESLQTKFGNQLAGFDMRWADTIAGLPYSVYGQTIGEDSPSPGTLQISDKSFLYGIGTQFDFLEQRLLVNFEYSDTQANCGPDGDTSQDCFYEHGTYRSGYRYYGRTIGSAYDNDAETLTLTIFGQQMNGNNWKVKLRNLDLNTNDNDLYPNDPNLGNSVSKVAEHLNQLDMQYQFKLHYGKLTVGALLSDSKIGQNSSNDLSYYFKYDYGFNN